MIRVVGVVYHMLELSSRVMFRVRGVLRRSGAVVCDTHGILQYVQIPISPRPGPGDGSRLFNSVGCFVRS